MKLSIRNPKDFWSGIFFVLTGLAAILIARRYAFGNAEQMGPGFFPTILGGLLVCLGLLAAGRGLNFHAEAEPIPKLKLRPLAAVLSSVILFAALLRPLGLVAASMLLVIVARLAGGEYYKREVLVSALVLTAFCALVFAWGLKLDLPVWPAFFRS